MLFHFTGASLGGRARGSISVRRRRIPARPHDKNEVIETGHEYHFRWRVALLVRTRETPSWHTQPTRRMSRRTAGADASTRRERSRLSRDRSPICFNGRGSQVREFAVALVPGVSAPGSCAGTRSAAAFGPCALLPADGLVACRNRFDSAYRSDRTDDSVTGWVIAHRSRSSAWSFCRSWLSLPSLTSVSLNSQTPCP